MRRALILLTVSAVACGTVSSPPTDAPAQTEPLAAPSTETPAPPPSETPLPPAPVDVTGFPDPNSFQWAEFVGGLDHPVDVQHAGDGSGRLFIVEKAGRVRVVRDGRLLEAPFLDITGRVTSLSSEQGLLGLGFHPAYETSGYFYVNYTEGLGDTVIARYQVTQDPDVADPASEKRLLGVDQPFPNHNGGAVVFGPDGYLYLGLGDGGAAGDPFGNGQNLETFLGKVLRLDVDHGDPYAIPPDNPFGTEIWHYGLRNPWRLSFDRSGGDLYIADVGQNAWEEIDFAPAGVGGLNFGWDLFEGSHEYEGGAAEGLAMPVAEYDHGQGCSVTGGYVYRGALAEWQGIYIYGDYCSGRVWGLIHSEQSWQAEPLFELGASLSSFGEDEAGELYAADYGQGIILRLQAR